MQRPSSHRTSASHPLRIAEIEVPDGGTIGLTLAPGKHQLCAMSGTWQRDLATDLDVIQAWRADMVVSVLEPPEFEELGIEQLPRAVATRGMRWLHLSITDLCAPSTTFLEQWPVHSIALRKELFVGNRVLIHCKGGLGRSGTVAAMLLMDWDQRTAADAIAKVREARGPKAIDPTQDEFLRTTYQAAGFPGRYH